MLKIRREIESTHHVINLTDNLVEPESVSAVKKRTVKELADCEVIVVRGPWSIRVSYKDLISYARFIEQNYGDQFPIVQSKIIRPINGELFS